jgi:hypothetical protein
MQNPIGKPKVIETIREVPVEKITVVEKEVVVERIVTVQTEVPVVKIVEVDRYIPGAERVVEVIKEVPGPVQIVEITKDVLVDRTDKLNQEMKRRLGESETTVKQIDRLLADKCERYGFPTDIDVIEKVKLLIHAMED